MTLIPTNSLANNSVEYRGKLSEYQTEGYTPGQRRERYQHRRFNNQQYLLYKRAIYGLSIYSNDDLKTMHWNKKKRIKHTSKRAQKSINILKQEYVNMFCEVIYSTLFPNTTTAKWLFSSTETGTDPDFINTLDLKDLGINRSMVVERFIKDGVLPRDFYELKQAA